ncbi:MAG: N-acetylmuramoyl-L-alanine amidase, partial [Neisseria sp.]
MYHIDKIVIHCAASTNGQALGSSKQSAAQVIDGWHA